MSEDNTKWFEASEDGWWFINRMFCELAKFGCLFLFFFTLVVIDQCAN